MASKSNNSTQAQQHQHLRPGRNGRASSERIGETIAGKSGVVSQKQKPTSHVPECDEDFAIQTNLSPDDFE